MKTTYKRTATAQITTKPGRLKAYFLGTNGIANGNLKIYDVAAAADIADSNCLIDMTVVAASFYGGRNLPDEGLQYYNGLYIVVTGDGAYYFSEYKNH